jgi:hypothetical protein
MVLGRAAVAASSSRRCVLSHRECPKTERAAPLIGPPLPEPCGGRAPGLTEWAWDFGLAAPSLNREAAACGWPLTFPAAPTYPLHYPVTLSGNAQILE